MSRARATAPKLAPALKLDGPAPPAPMARLFHAPPRDWSAVHEWIPTACERLIERRTTKSESLFSLWEPVIEGASYSVTRPGKGKAWGLAHTRRPRSPLSGRDAIEWEVQQQKRAMDVLTDTLPELAGALAEGVYRGLGTILLSGNPRDRAAFAVAKKVPTS